MKRVTIRLDEDVLRECCRRSAEEKVSLSRWLRDLIRRTVSSEDPARFAQARQRAIRTMKEGFDLGGQPLSRDDCHER
ncbi:MAG: hypothetical protein RL885_12610 [Planctomycetota bacterium]